MTPPASSEASQFSRLLTALGRDPESGLIVCNTPIGGRFRVAYKGPVAEAIQAIDGLSGDVYFSTQPMRIPEWGRGGTEDALGLTCLFADLDASPGKLGSVDNCWRVIEGLTDILDALPVAVVDSGHGLHPYWIVTGEGTTWAPDDEVSAHRASRVLKRFGALVADVARDVVGEWLARPLSAEMEGRVVETPRNIVDGVFELARVLRVPGTRNHKSPEPAQVNLARLLVAGRPLTMAELEQRLDAEPPPPAANIRPAMGRDRRSPRGQRTGADDPASQLSSFKARLEELGLKVLGVRSQRFADGWEWRSTCPAHGLDGEIHSTDALSFGVLAEVDVPVFVWHCHAGCALLEEQGIRTAMGYWVSNCETTNHLLGAGSPLDGARRWCYLSVPRSDDALSEPLPKGTIEIFTQCSGDCGDGVDDEDGPCTCVVRAVQRALDEMGLTHTWNGHAYDPVLVSDLDWKMRLPT